MNKKEYILQQLKEGRHPASIAEEIACTPSYIYKLGRTNGIEVSFPLKKCSPEYFTADKTIKEIAEEIGVGQSAARKFAITHDLPYKEVVKRMSDEELEIIAGMVFLGASTIHRSGLVDASIDRIYRELHINGYTKGEYTNKDMLHTLRAVGAERTAMLYDLDEEVLHNIMYVHEYKECPYTNATVKLSKSVSDVLDGKSTLHPLYEIDGESYSVVGGECQEHNGVMRKVYKLSK